MSQSKSGVVVLLWLAACASDAPSGSGGGGGPGGGSGDGFFATTRPRLCVEGWCWENPYPHGRLNRSVWLADADDVYVVGDGPAFHIQGGVVMPLSVPDIGAHRAVWGTSASDVWIVGTTGTAHFSGGSWTTHAGGGTSVHGSSASDVWVVGGAATYSWNGSLWQEETTAPLGDVVWVADSTRRFILGSSAWRHLSTGWEQLTWPSSGDAIAAFGLSADSLWVVSLDTAGPTSELLYWGGASFAPVTVDLDVGELITGVWAASAADVFVSTTDGLRFDDGVDWEVGSWSSTDYMHLPGVLAPFSALTGSAADDVWAVGAEGQVAHFDGSTWAHFGSRLFGLDVGSLWYDASGIWFSSWDTIQRYTANGYASFDLQPSAEVDAIWGDGRGTIFGVGPGGYAVRIRSGQTTHMTAGSGWWLNAVWGSSASNVWAVGGSDTVARYEGEAWQDVTYGPDAGVDVADVTGIGTSDVWITGPWLNDVWHWDGTGWEGLGNGSDGRALSAPSATCLWLAKESGVARYLEQSPCVGSCWSTPITQQPSFVLDLHAPRCDEAVAVGEGGAIWRYADGVETTIDGDVVTDQDLVKVMAGPDDVTYAFGTGDVILSLRP